MTRPIAYLLNHNLVNLEIALVGKEAVRRLAQKPLIQVLEFYEFRTYAKGMPKFGVKPLPEAVLKAIN